MPWLPTWAPVVAGQKVRAVHVNGLRAKVSELVDRVNGERVLDVVADGTTTTTVTATGGVLDYDVLDVARSDPEGERASIVLPHPSDWPNQVLWLVGDDMGASVGYPLGPQPAVLGDLNSLSPAEVDFSTNPVTVDFDVNGDTVSVTIEDDYTGDVAGLYTALLTAVLATGDVTYETNYLDIIGNRENLGGALVTVLTGAGASLSVTDPGTGGAGNTADPLGLAVLDNSDGADEWYAGWDNNRRGVGELNAPAATGFTHSWFDGPGYTAKSLGLFSDGDRLHALRIPLRWEEVYGVTPEIDGPLDDARNVGQAIGIINAALKDIDERVTALEP